MADQEISSESYFCTANSCCGEPDRVVAISSSIKLKRMLQSQSRTVDGRHPANQLRLVVYLIICWGLTYPRWCRISSINRMIESHAAEHQLEIHPDCLLNWTKFRWWFQIFIIFIPIWIRFPFWLSFLRGVETPTRRASRVIVEFGSQFISSVFFSVNSRYGPFSVPWNCAWFLTCDNRKVIKTQSDSKVKLGDIHVAY